MAPHFAQTSVASHRRTSSGSLGAGPPPALMAAPLAAAPRRSPHGTSCSVARLRKPPTLPTPLSPTSPSTEPVSSRLVETTVIAQKTHSGVTQMLPGARENALCLLREIREKPFPARSFIVLQKNLFYLPCHFFQLRSRPLRRREPINCNQDVHFGCISTMASNDAALEASLSRVSAAPTGSEVLPLRRCLTPID